MIQKKMILCLTLLTIVLFSACSALPADTGRAFYASFRPDQDKLMMIKTESILLSPTKELHARVFDYLKEGDSILSLDIEDDAKVQETIEDVKQEIESLSLNITLNESTMLLYEKRLSQSAPSTEMEQYEVANMENQLNLTRHNQTLLEESLQEANLKLTAAENTLKQDRIIRTPFSGYLMDLVMKWNDDGVFLVGSMLPENGVYLELNHADSSEFSDGQKIDVYMFDQWIPMIVALNGAGVRLNFDGIAADILRDIQFTYPIIVQIK